VLDVPSQVFRPIGFHIFQITHEPNQPAQKCYEWHSTEAYFITK